MQLHAVVPHEGKVKLQAQLHCVVVIAFLAPRERTQPAIVDDFF
jgi:hypothetical protein